MTLQGQISNQGKVTTTRISLYHILPNIPIKSDGEFGAFTMIVLPLPASGA